MVPHDLDVAKRLLTVMAGVDEREFELADATKRFLDLRIRTETGDDRDEFGESGLFEVPAGLLPINLLRLDRVQMPKAVQAQRRSHRDRARTDVHPHFENGLGPETQDVVEQHVAD